ncbi:hypothetical protein B0H13DRAFT_2354532 [Mycena leptocephala]|nr:hypothetical protein B0H13DRAFT_2354532 [Mycena leptocephala]
MLWYPLGRRTRSGAEFSPFSLPQQDAPPTQADALQTRDLDFGALLERAVASEGDNQEDHEEDDALNDVDDEWPLPGPLDGVDEQWPPPPPPDPWNEVDNDNPHPPPPKKPRRKPSFDEVVASTDKPLTGPHRTRPAKPSKSKQTAAANKRRAAKRAKTKAEMGHVPAASTISAHVRPAVPLATSLIASTLPAALGAYAARVEDKAEKRGRKACRTLADLLKIGFHLIRWDGFTPRPLIDKYGRIFAVLAGQPHSAAYAAAAHGAFIDIMKAGAGACFPADMRRHRRGLYAVINVGLSYGQGQRIPGWLDNKEYSNLADGLLASTNVKRLAGFADAAFALWAPRLYRYYHDYNAALHQRHPDLRRPFGHSVFFCAAFNFGPNVWTFRHRDVLNLAFGWCTVQALGEFDPTKGGHLVLWDLNLVVEFPAGSLILLPSATLAHSNVPVARGEKRASFTQFSAGGIFRYVDNGCRTEEQLAEEDPEEHERLMALKASRWEMGLNLLSTVDELLVA